VPRWLYHLLAPSLLALAALGLGGRALAASPADSLPVCGSLRTLIQPISLHDVIVAAQRAGLATGALAMAGAVAEAESRGDVRAACENTDAWRSHDRGLWQINDHYHPEVSDAAAFTVDGNAAAMARISSDGADWGQWNAYTSGSYQGFLRAAQDVVAGLGGGGATIVLQQPFHGLAGVTQPYGPTVNQFEYAYNGYPHFHTGVDYALDQGTPLYAAGAGRVVVAGPDPTGAHFNGGYGLMIKIDHGQGVETLYGHLSAVSVRVGDTVAAGDPIGASGGDPPSGVGTNSGNSTGHHLHFGVSVGGAWVDPATVLKDGVQGDPNAKPDPAGASSGGCGGLDAFGHCLTITNPLDGAGNAIGSGIQQLFSGLFSTIDTDLARWLEQLLRPFAVMNIWTDTPRILTYGNSYVKMGWGYCIALADALMVIFMMGAGVKRMWDGFAGRRVPPATVQIARFVVWGALANVSLLVLGAVIDTSNRIVQLVGLFDNKEILADLLGLVGLANLPALLAGGPLLWIFAVVLLLVKIVIFVALFLNMLYRIALIIFTLVTSPLAFMCFGFESLEKWGRKWNDAFWSALIQQFLQVVMLRVAFGMSTDVADITDAFLKEFTASINDTPDPVEAAARAAVAAIASAIMLGLVSLILMFFVLKIPRMINLQVAVAAGTAAAGGAIAAMGWKVGGQAITAAAGAVGGPIAAAGATMLGTAAFGRPMAFGGDMVAAGIGGGAAAAGSRAASVVESGGSTTLRDAGVHGQVTRQREWSEVRTRADGRESTVRTTTTTVPAGASESGRDERTVETDTRDTPYEPHGGQAAAPSWSDLRDAQRQWTEGRRARRGGHRTA